jgi:hypothetical protein
LAFTDNIFKPNRILLQQNINFKEYNCYFRFVTDEERGQFLIRDIENREIWRKKRPKLWQNHLYIIFKVNYILSYDIGLLVRKLKAGKQQLKEKERKGIN